MDVPSSRASVDESISSCNKGQENGSPPNKYRRTRDGNDAFSTERKRIACSTPQYSSDCPSPCGFGPSELLPLDHETKAAVILEQRRLFSETADTTKLSDDALGLCLFGGFLDSFEVVRLTTVSKRIRRIACKQVKRLDLRNCKHLTPTNIASISASFQNLTDLDFSYCSQFGEEHLHQLVPLSNTLKNLSLKGTEVDDGSITSYLTKVHANFGTSMLESIDLSATTREGSTLVGDISAHSLAVHCPNLKNLCLAWSTILTDEGVCSISCLTNLERLDLSLTGISSNSAHYLLEMMKNGQLTDLDLSATNMCLEGISQLFSKSDLNIKKMGMRFVDELTPGLVETMLRQAPALSYLDISHSGVEGRIRLMSSLSGIIQERGIILKGAYFAPTANNNKASP